MKIHFHTEENLFSYGGNSIFMRRKIYFQAEEPQWDFTAKLFFPIFVEDTMR